MDLHNTTHDAALRLIDVLAAHLPAHLDVGQPSVVTDRDVLTDRGELIALDEIDGPDGDRVWVGSRTVLTGHGLAEVTSWHRGREVERRVGQVDAADMA